MLECLFRILFDGALDFLKEWLRDWGNLLLTAAITVAAFMQGIFAARLYRLQKSMEEERLTPLLFCRISGQEFVLGTWTTLEAQLWNLSQHGVWIDRLEVVLNGPVASPLMNFTIEKILQASQVEAVQFSEMPFENIVPLGPNAPKEPVTFKVQAKFSYSTASVLGVWVSPIYEATLQGTVLRDLKKTNDHSSVQLKPPASK
jgi:hypothetical protein